MPVLSNKATGGCSEAFIFDVVGDFLGRLEWKPLPHGVDATLEKAVLKKISTWDISDKARKVLQASASVAISMGSLAYGQHDFEPNFLLTMMNTLLIYVDNTVHANRVAYDEFTPRFIARKKQLDPVLEYLADFLPRFSNFYEPFAASMMGLSVCQFVSGCCIEDRVNEMTISQAAVEWPWTVRTLTGVAPVFSYGIFPKDKFPGLTTYVQAIPEIDRFINLGNDVLSFYKEEMANETENYVHTVSLVSGVNPSKVLEQTVEGTITAHDRVTKILSESDNSGELVAIWKTFARGYLAFHMQHDRYRLAQHFEGRFDA